MPTRTATSSPTRDPESVGTESVPRFSFHPARNCDGSSWIETLCTHPPPRNRIAQAERRRSLPPGEEHGIAVAEEAVLPLHRLPVRGEHTPRAAEGADEHEQRRAGEVKVRDERVHRAERVGRADEEARPPRPGCDPFAVEGALEGPDGRRPHRDDAPAAGAAGGNGGGRGGGHVVAL